MKKNKSQVVNYKFILKYSLSIFLFLSVVIFTILFLIESKVIELKNEELEKHEVRIVKQEMNLLAKETDLIVSNLLYLSETFKMKNFNDKWGVVAEEWKILADKMKIYDQIRFIDEFGDEKIRINYSEKGSVIIDESKLQNKKDRYYFYETAKLEEGQVYISKLDLNIENNEIEKPIKPMIRFSTPLYNENGKFLGIIILNHIAKIRLEEFKEIAKNSLGEVYLLNSSGYWICGSNPDQEWTFMFDDVEEISFKNTYPSEWKRIKNDNGSFYSGNGLFTYTDVIIKDKIVVNESRISKGNIVLGDENFKVVSFVSKEGDYGNIINPSKIDIAVKLFSDYKIYFVFVAIIAFIISLLIFINKQSMLKIKFFSEYDSMTKVLNRRAGLALLNKNIPGNNEKVNRISLCFIDINGLKEVNDTLGHDAGDELILSIIDIIKKNIRESDFIIRFGGDEFLLVFPNSNKENAEKTWDRIVESFDKINTEENRPYMISVSHGISEYKNNINNSLEDLIKVSDEKMYEEKRQLKKDLQVIKNNLKKKNNI